MQDKEKSDSAASDIVISPQQIAAKPASETDPIALSQLLAGVGQAAFQLDLATDEMRWSAGSAMTLGLRSDTAMATGAMFQSLVAPEHSARRQQAMPNKEASTADAPSSGEYTVRYRYSPGGRRGVAARWVEEYGSWHTGPDGHGTLVQGVVRLLREDESDQRRIDYLEDHDELSGQLNRARLYEAIKTVIARCDGSRRPAAFLMVEITNLGSINDTFGFEVGDEVIARVGERLRARMRSGDIIGRHSSNKFGIILNDCAPLAIKTAAARLIDAVGSQTISTSVGDLPASVAIGAAQLSTHARTSQQAVAYALEALEKTGNRRAGGFFLYEPNRRGETERQRNQALADKIVLAIQEHRMHLALQPIVCARTNEVSFHECLLRLEHPDGRITSAGEFIAVAEKLGLGSLVDRRALELAVALLKKRPDLHLGINVSSLTTSDHEWLVSLHKLTGGRHDIIRRLSVEITESAAIEDLDQTMSFVDALKELGCSVAIDDFGAGYTSFRNLKYLAVDMVKIDGSFVRNMLRDRTDRVFVETLVALARSFNAKTVAEWVGDAETAAQLRTMGVDYLQGFHFGEPQLVSPEETAPHRAAG